MSMTANYRIVVGVDGSDGGHRALSWAVREAERRGGTVQAVTAWRWDGVDLPPHATTHPEQEREEARRILEGEVARLTAGSPITVASEVVEGRAADVLTSVARDADLLVIGSHGHSRVWHTVLGSVSEECVRKATCPVVVLPVTNPQLTDSGQAIAPREESGSTNGAPQHAETSATNG